MRLLFTFNAKSLARFGLVSGRSIFNGGTVCRRRPLQQGKFEGYGSQYTIQEGNFDRAEKRLKKAVNINFLH